MDSPQAAELLNALSALLASGRFSDLTVICKDQRYAVHKALLCSRSYFFDRACSSGFLESTNGVIDLSEDNEEAVEHMMNYFYRLDYLEDTVSAPKPSQSATVPSWIDSKQQKPALKKLDFSAIEDPLVAMANARQPSAPSSPIMSPTEQAARVPSPSSTSDRKRSPSPTTSAKSESCHGHRRMRSRKYSRASEGSPRSPTLLELADSLHLAEPSADGDDEYASPDIVMHARVYALAEKFGIPGLKALAKKKFEVLVQSSWSDEDLPEAMEEVYESTIEDDRGLRDVIVQAFRSHLELAYRPDVAELIHAVEPLAWDLHRVQNGIPISV